MKDPAVYTCPKGKKWTIAKGGLPRRLKTGDRFIESSDGHVGHWDVDHTSRCIYTIVTPIEPRRFTFVEVPEKEAEGRFVLNGAFNRPAVYNNDPNGVPVRLERV